MNTRLRMLFLKQTSHLRYPKINKISTPCYQHERMPITGGSTEHAQTAPDAYLGGVLVYLIYHPLHLGAQSVLGPVVTS